MDTAVSEKFKVQTLAATGKPLVHGLSILHPSCMNTLNQTVMYSIIFLELLIILGQAKANSSIGCRNLRCSITIDKNLIIAHAQMKTLLEKIKYTKTEGFFVFQIQSKYF